MRFSKRDLVGWAGKLKYDKRAFTIVLALETVSYFLPCFSGKIVLKVLLAFSFHF